jgi:hypothetical protein
MFEIYAILQRQFDQVIDGRSFEHGTLRASFFMGQYDNLRHQSNP